jgi:beta-N-acetylhexosaminidase
VQDNPWGLRGRFLPDDLEMGGCTEWNWEARVRLALEAGHQWLLVCQTPEGWTACSEAAARLPESLWGPALAATRTMRRHLPTPVPFGVEAWQAWLARIQAATKDGPVRSAS